MLENNFRSLKLLLLIFVCFLSFPTSVFAHVLVKDGSIGAVVHISPEDDPIVGESASFFFEFKDTKNNFELEDCICTVKIRFSGTEVHSEQLSDGSSLASPSFSYSFPQKGVYKLVVEGSPSTDQSFNSFKLEYDLRVSRTSSGDGQQNFLTENIQYLALVAILLLFLCVAFYNRPKKRPQEPKSPSKMPVLFLLILAAFILHQTSLTYLIPSHHQSTDQHQEHSCCLSPQALPVTYQTVETPINSQTEKLLTSSTPLGFVFFGQTNTRSPPSFS